MKNIIEKQNTAKTSGARFAPMCEWRYSLAALEASNKIPEKTVSEQSHALGMLHGEPLIMAMDALLQYASVYKSRYGGNLDQDGVLGQYWLDAIKGLRGLLNGDGSIAMQRDISTDSKDNGALETMFWTALEIAGFTEKNL